ncbi:MAG: VWA domain-containing protein [Myxococcaceae bacterium]
MTKKPFLCAAIAFVVGLAAACSDSYLYDERREDQLPVDRTFAIEGRFCSLGTNDVVRPIKILVAMDASQSMSVTDPDGTRAKALIDLIDALPADPEVYLSVMLFAGSTTVYLTNNNSQGFQQVTTFTDNDKVALRQQILTFTVPGNAPNRDSTDFVKALADIYESINSDIANARASTNATVREKNGRARYAVIFLSDGHPTNNQDDELIDGDAVTRIRQLKDLVEDVRVNTVHVFNPAQPLSTICDLYSDAGQGCPLLIVNDDAERLSAMAVKGAGEFRDFRNNEPINFLNFKFGNVRRAYEVKDFTAMNFSALPGSPADQADSDSDHLSDADEIKERTDPLNRDTDGDGFSDGVEVYFRAHGAAFTPNQIATPDGGGLDIGCPPNLRGIDTDCDGLLDCDEQLIGTNPERVDSDNDGVPDGTEWFMHTEGSSPDLEQDPDLDGLLSREEIHLHTDPLAVDTSSLSVNGYRYVIDKDGDVDADGRQCYHFRVDNILLANTLQEVSDAGTMVRGAGYNELYLSLAMLPQDDPSARTQVRHWRFKQVRYPVGGIKSPVDGVIHVEPDDLQDRCQVRDAGTP